MPGIGLPVRRAISSKDVSDLQLGTGQDPDTSLQASPQGLILQIGQHLVGADRVLDRLRGDVCVLRRGGQFGVAEQDLNDPDIRVRLKQVRRKAMPERVQRGGFGNARHVLG